jgi:hypothetical protein
MQRVLYHAEFLERYNTRCIVANGFVKVKYERNIQPGLLLWQWM